MEPKEIIKSARVKKGLTQEEVATKLHIELRTYQRYEEGKFPKFKGDIVKGIDKILDTSIYDIIYDNNLHDTKVSGVLMTGIESKYLALLEKTISDKDKNIEEKEADLVALRSAVNGIAEVKNKVDRLEPIVYGLSNKVGDVETSIEVLREWLIDQFSKLKKESPQSVAASMGRKWAEIQDKQHGTRAG